MTHPTGPSGPAPQPPPNPGPIGPGRALPTPYGWLRPTYRGGYLSVVDGCWVYEPLPALASPS